LIHFYKRGTAPANAIMALFMPVCANCRLYSWEPTKVPSPVGPFYIKENSTDPLQRCSKCKVVFYCDKDCQTEHWEKVHKDKCKYLRGDKEMKAEVHKHQELSCSSCKEEKEVGNVIKMKDDPHWGCHMAGSRDEFWNNPTFTYRSSDGDLYDAPLSMEIGEFTGNYTSRVEHVVSILQKILYKMEITEHKLSKREEFDNLSQEIFFLRHDFLMTAVTIPVGRLVHHSHSFQLMESGTQQRLLGIIRALSKGYDDNIQDEYRLWDTFILIFDYFLDVLKDNMQNYEDIGKRMKDKKFRMLVSQIEPPSKVQEKWDLVVVALSKGLVPYIKILEIVLGNLMQNCTICKKRVKIESTFGDHPSGSLKERRPVAMCQGHVIKYHCGKDSCRKAMVDKHAMENMSVLMPMIEEIKKYKKNRCDWCKTLKKEVHRCSRCLTKVYCNKECLKLDWEKVHHKVCKEKPDIRKQKLKKLQVMADSDLPETITLTNGEVMKKRKEPVKNMTCPMAPCPDQENDEVGFYRHQLLLFVPWGKPGQPDFSEMSDTEVVRFYNKRRHDIEIVRRRLEAKNGGFIHLDRNGRKIDYQY